MNESSHLVEGFEFELFKRLSTQENLVFSPSSIGLALGMAAIGSSGESKAAFQRIFDFTNAENLVKQVKSMQESLTSNSAGGAQCLIANKIY